MRKFLLVLGVLLLCATGTRANHVIVQSGGSAADDNNTATTTAVDTTGATLLVMFCSYFQNGSITVTPSDSKTNTWTAVTAEVTSPVIAGRMYYVNSATPTVGASHTFTCSGTGSFPSAAFIAASGGVATPLDVTNTDTVASGTTLDHNGGVTPTQNFEMVITGLASFAEGTQSIDGGYTIAYQNAWVNGSTVAVGLGYLLQSTATSTNPSWSWSGNHEAASVLASFKSNGAPTGACTMATTGAGRC